MLNLIQISDLLLKVKIGFKMAAGKINGTNQTTLLATSKKKSLLTLAGFASAIPL